MLISPAGEKREIIQGLQTRLGLGIGGDLLVHIAAKADTFSIDQYGKSLTATSQKNALFALTYSIMNDKNLDNEQKALALDYLRQKYTSAETVHPGELGQDIEQMKQVKTGPDLGSIDPDYVRQHYDEIAERIMDPDSVKKHYDEIAERIKKATDTDKIKGKLKKN